MDPPRTGTRLALAAVSVLLAAVGIGSGEQSPTTFTPLTLGPGACRAYPMDTLGDVRAHTDAVVLATVLAEREGTGRGPIFEGEPLVWRSITVRNDRTLWQKQGAPVPPATFETGGGGWSQSNGTRRPFWWWGDVGKQYLYVLVKDTGDSGTSWSHELELLAPIMDGRTPTQIDSEKPWFAEIKGKTPDELEQLFAAKLGA